MKVSIGHFFGKCLWLFLFFYICSIGHVVNGQTDPCLSQPCNVNATCSHNEGVVKCTCIDGFYGDGTMCTECSRNVPDEKFGSNCSSPCTCASNAECDSVTGVCFGDVCGALMPTTCDKNELIVTILQEDMDVDEKTAFTLECTVNLGTADVTVTWTYPAGADIQSVIVRNQLTSILTVSNAGKEDSGTYTCIAWLKKQTETVTSRNDSVNINVRVQGAISPGFKNLRKARIGDNVTLTCEAFGNPIPTVEWLYKNDTNINGITMVPSEISVTPCCVVTRKLHFPKLTLANNGTYTCKVSVDGNVTDREEVDLFVVDFPEIYDLSLQEKSSSSLKFTWKVKDYGNDNITCKANYFEIGINKEMSQSCEETSCELSNLSPNTGYNFSVVCNNTAGLSNTLRMTSKTLATVPEEVPDFNDAVMNSTFITVTLTPVSTENGPISCYEFVVAERSEVPTEPDKDFPFSSVKENSDKGTPYRAIVMDHDEYNAQKTVIIGAEGNQESTCVLPGNSRRKRASELVSSQTLTARNDPLESASNYSIFLRIYVISHNGEYNYSSSDYQHYQTTKEEMSPPSNGLVVALIVIVFIILVVSIAVVVILRRKSTQTDSAKRQSNKADVNYENEGLSRSTVYVNEQQTSNVDALSYEPVQNQASGGMQLDQLPRTLPDSKVESSYDHEVTAIPKQNTALPEPPVSQDLDKVIYEDMPDELNYSHALYNQEKAPVPFKVSELPDYIHQRRLGGRNALEMEFMTLPQGQLEPWTEAVKKQNVYKGRNPDVLPYDSSRVRLVFDSINHSDYYNASFIMDQHNRQSFIAAESPSKDTADAFLWMIWQEKVAIVVMVSDMNDSAEQTCSPYWPMKEGTSRHYGKMSVALKVIKNYPDYSVRELLIMKKGEDSISVTQFHYHSWPYRRVAEHPTSLLDYIKDVKLCLKRRHFPLLVHCSDGAGATGTFIGLFCLLNELTQSSEISIYHFVKKMRKNRINMVGTKAQYVFIYEVLLLAYQTPVTVYSAHDFKKLVINKRKLSGQFQSLLKPKYQIDAQSGSATENKNRNRFSKIIPLDVSSPHLQCTSLLGGSGYINACFANSYFKKNAFILTQSPLPTTVEDFWRMVYDQKSTKIIMLNMLDSTDKTCNLYWPSGGNCQYGSVLVECTGTVTKDLYVCREMVVKHQDDEQASVKLKHFQLLSWPEGKTAIHVIRFIEAVGFSEGPEPVLVHCIDGVGHSGVYVTIHNEMQRFKDSDKVDIFQTVQSLRERNPHVFSTLKDFLFCYEALQASVNKVA